MGNAIIDQIKVRIDDKLNRMKKGNNYPGDDDERDLIGYLILLQIAKGLSRTTISTTLEPGPVVQVKDGPNGI